VDVMKRVADWYRRRRSGPRATTKLFMQGRDLFAALRVSETDMGTRRWDVALELFRDGKRMVFEDVGFHFEKFRELVAGRRVKLELIYDYGMGSVLLAERDGEIARARPGQDG
jgi:hypothetical protein